MIPKFRAWDKIRNRISEVERIYIDTKGVRLRDENGEYWRRFDDVILMQSTGLFDKNGQEIFEGDVVKIMDEDGDSEISAVTFKHGASGMTITGVFVPFVTMIVEATVDYTLEIISNIHANPELVEGVENE
ncbi:YopX family protein [Streptococcus suis]|uniref:YopX family protein n=1 Tax=Streptococcus suis TaxID=1307 RepID=UPI000CF575C5|nr:YopX family protein [Streptococcus suis]